MNDIEAFGTIRIHRINKAFFRLTVETDKSVYLDQLEAQGETLAEALLGLHEQAEAVQ
jgi:hypothetical protein